MIVVAPLHEIDDAIARWRPSHIVSLASPGAEPARLPDHVETLRLTFHDIPGPREGLTPATRDDVERLLAFARGWTQAGPLLVHCWAGVSRSPAAAYVLACARSEPGDEAALAAALRAAAPFATPNARVVALADEALGRGGRMRDAIAAIGRGAETSMGSTFRLQTSDGL